MSNQLKFWTDESILKLLSILNEINERIGMLNTFSSEDFHKFNAQLKTNAKYIEMLSEHLKKIESLGDHDSIQILQTGLNQIDSYVHLIEGKLEDFQMNVEKLERLIELTIVPHRNLNQKLVSINLIIANFGSLYQMAGTDTFIQEKELITSHKQFKSKHNELFTETQILLHEIIQFSRIFKELKSRWMYQLLGNLNHLTINLNYFTEKEGSYTPSLDALLIKIDQFKNSIGQIVVHLQYEDIIRQRMEHIQYAYSEIARILHQQATEPDPEKQFELFIDSYFQIKQVLDLQVGQLLNTNNQYQKAIQNMSSRFLEMKSNVENIADISNDIISSSILDSMILFTQIKTGFENIFEYTGEIEKQIDLSNTQITKLTGLFNKLMLKTEEVKKTGEEYQSLLKHLSKQLKSKFASNTNTYDDFQMLLNDIQFDFRYIESLSGQIQMFTSDLKQLKTVDDGDENNGRYAYDSQEINLKLKKVGDIYSNIDIALKQTSIAGNQISEFIRDGLSQIKYYDYYDKITQQIISLMNSVNQFISQIDFKSIQSNNAELLDKIAQKYTMVVEREIMENSLSGKKETIINKENDSEVEFF